MALLLVTASLALGLVGHVLAQPLYRLTTFDTQHYFTGVVFLSNLNDAGEVAGEVWWSATNTQSFAWGNDRLFPVDEFVAGDHGSNDLGQFVRNIGERAHLWTGTEAIDLGTLGSRFSVARDLNNSGQIVGFYDSPGEVGNGAGTHAALWDAHGAPAVDLNTLLRPSAIESGWVLRDAWAINEAGWIVGTAFNTTYCPEGCKPAGFLLSLSDLPDQHVDLTSMIPEPSSYALLLAGLGALAWRARSRRSIGMPVQRRRAANVSR
jgi:hypothetical protein